MVLRKNRRSRAGRTRSPCSTCLVSAKPRWESLKSYRLAHARQYPPRKLITQRVASTDWSSVLVVVIIVGGVAATVVDVIHVISMRNRDMATTAAVPMVMPLMHGVLTRRRLALVVMTVMVAVQVSVMDVIHVVSMRDSDMPAPLTMRMLMARVLDMRRSVGHLRFSFDCRDRNRPPGGDPRGHVSECVSACGTPPWATCRQPPCSHLHPPINDSHQFCGPVLGVQPDESHSPSRDHLGFSPLDC
jgi:hypothetical protein